MGFSSRQGRKISVEEHIRRFLLTNPLFSQLSTLVLLKDQGNDSLLSHWVAEHLKRSNRVEVLLPFTIERMDFLNPHLLLDT